MAKKSKYSPEFMEQAVKRTLSGSYSIKEVSESLGVSYYVLRGWRKEYMEKKANEVPKTDKEIQESEELKRLRKENLKLREENAILKKFAAILSKEKELD